MGNPKFTLVFIPYYSPNNYVIMENIATYNDNGNGDMVLSGVSSKQHSSYHSFEKALQVLSMLSNGQVVLAMSY